MTLEIAMYVLSMMFALGMPADEVGDLLGKAQAAMKQGDLEGAKRHADAAVAKDPRSVDALLIRGQIGTSRREFAAAIDDFSRALQLDPSRPDALDLRGTTHFKMAKIKESLADYDQYIRMRPMAAAAHWRRGLTLYYADKFADGVAQFTTSDKEEPNDVENAVWHFLCNARVKGIEKARGEFLKVGRDSRGEYMMKIFEMFKGTAKPDEVFAAAEKGDLTDRKRDYQRFYAHYYVGMYLEATGDAKRSLEHLKKAVEKYPIGDYMMDVARVHIKLREKP